MVDLFIIVFLLFLWCWDYPADHPARKGILKVSSPFLYFGLWHGWAMFAPDPIHLNRWLRAAIWFDDGSTEDWEPMKPQKSRGLNTLYVRSFKFQHSMLCGKFPHLYTPVCRFLANWASEPHRKVVAIELFREFQYVNDYGADERDSEMKSVSFFRYKVPA